MKIVIFAPYFYPHRGGLEQFSWEISTRLAKKGHEIIVISSKIVAEPRAEEIEGIRILRVSTWNLLGGTFPIPMLSKTDLSEVNDILKEKTNIVITNTRFFPLSLHGLVLARKYHLKSFHIEHGTCHPKLSNPIASLIAYLYDQTFGRLVFKLADSHIAISKAAADFSTSLGGKNIAIIYNSVDTEFFRAKPRLEGNSITRVIYVGRLIKAKGIQHIINVLGKIEMDNVLLSIVGSGNYEQYLRKLAGASKRIEFLGEKNKNQVRGLLAESEIFVNPSYSEGLPTSVLEAGAMECSVIATDAGGTKEIIKNGKNGFLISAGDENMLSVRLTELLQNRKLRLSLGAALGETVNSTFSWDKTIEKLNKLLIK